MHKLRVTIAVAFIVLLSGSLYLATIRGVEGNPTPANLMSQEQSTQAFELSPERGRFAHVVALAETKKYALNQGLADFVYPDVGWYQGRFYSFFAPGMAYMALPFYLIGQNYNLAQLFTFGFVSFISILALVFIFLIAKNILKLPLWASLVAVIIFAFGSTAWSYAVTMYQHHVTVFFILSTFYAVWKYKQAGRLSWLWASWVWLGYGLALSIDYPNAVLLSPVIVYFFISSTQFERIQNRVRIGLRGAFLLTSIFFVLVTGLHLLHNQLEFGSWKRLSGSLADYKVIKENSLENKSIAEITSGVQKVADKKGNVVNFFSENKLPNSFGTLLFSTDRGLLFYGPIFIFGILGLLFALKFLNTELAVLMSLSFVNIFLYSSWGDPWGGWAYGTRYLIPTMSIFALFAAYWFTKSPRAWISRLVALPLFAYSCAVALVGVLTTNAVPPRVEADFLHSKYNYLYNIDFLKDGRSGSYLFNTYLHQHITLIQYYEILFSIVFIVFGLVIIVGPLINRKDNV